ncbi:TPA: hypothetical protein JAX37_004779 [Enterobacter cloacae]|nr:hypothetical protein [Enterobacter cloacae]
MYRNTFGFLINDNIQVDIWNRRIIKFTTLGAGRSYHLSVSITVIKEQSMTLLAYLLSNGRNGFVKRDEILNHVWDQKNLRSSSQILWAALKELKSELVSTGLDENFIRSEKGCFYSVNAKKIIELQFNK